MEGKHKHRKDDNVGVTAVNAPPEGHIGTGVYDSAMSATDGVPNSRDHSKAPTFAQRKGKIDPISPENYDPWVYKTSKENMGNFPQWHFDTNIENGLGNSKAQTHRHNKHHKKHHSKPDIAERGMDEEVHGFASANTPPLNTRVRSTLPFIPNGSSPSAFEGSASLNQKKHHKKHHHRQHPDIAERKMDGEVHGFAASIASPVNEIEHDKDAPAMNGGEAEEVPASLTLPASLTQTKKKTKLKDMGEGGYDPEVYGFASSIVSAINGQERPETPWASNGVYGWDAFAQQKKHHHKQHDSKPDIAERGMDEEVHGFAAANTPPLNTRVRSTLPFIPNGSSPSAFEGSASFN
jgi:hypothetical protein